MERAIEAEDPRKKVETIKEIVDWVGKVDRSKSIDTSYKSKSSFNPVEVDQIHNVMNDLKLLTPWWQEKGKTFAMNNAGMKQKEIKSISEKLEVTYKWLDKIIEDPSVAEEAAEEVAEKAAESAKKVEASKSQKELMKNTVEGKRATEMENALDWLRSNDFHYDDPGLDDQTLKSFKLLESVLPASSKISTDSKSHAMDHMLDFLRRPENQGITFDDLSQTSSAVSAAEGSAKISDARKTREEKKAKKMEDALDWLQKNQVDEEDDENSSTSKFSISRISLGLQNSAVNAD